MRIVVLTTSTNNTAPLYEPLEGLGHHVSIVVYDNWMDGHDGLPGLVESIDPDVVVLFGALEGHHGSPIPPVEVLAEIGAARLLVHLCFDGAEPLWWDQLARYYDHGRFALQVNIDGVRTGPIGERGLTTLCPIDSRSYSAHVPWSARTIPLGFAGNTHGGTRAAMLHELISRGLLTHRMRDIDGPEGYRDFMKSCRCAWNNPMTGGTTSKHVKARIAEAALAGCLVFEEAGSPLADWYKPGEDYVAYRDADDIARKLDFVMDHQAVAEDMAREFRAKVTANHSPSVFWGAVFHRLGLGGEPARYQPPFRYWARSGSQAAPIELRDDNPRLVRSEADGNLVAFKGATYKIPFALGHVDLRSIDLRRYPTIKEIGR